MQCDLCGHYSSPTRTLCCPTCARSEIYNLRIRLAKLILEKEDALKRLEAIKDGDNSNKLETLVLDGAIVNMYDCRRSLTYTTWKSKTIASKERREEIKDSISQVNEKVQDIKSQIHHMKSSLAQKRFNNKESSTSRLDQKSNTELDTIQKNNKRVSRVWDNKQVEMVRWRKFICREMTNLAGLSRQKVVEDQSIRYQYTIAYKLPIFDLRDLAKADAQMLTASLTQIAFLISRITTYLALQLPAEICLPDKNKPLTTIYQPYGSYSLRTHTSKQKPRLLSIKTPLSKLVKEDPDTFRYFIEGATLLAWNIAWLCKAQGMEGLENWKDVCNVGQNLYDLLLSDIRTKTGVKNGNVPLNFGQYSHGTSHFFFGSNESTSKIRKWQLHTPTKIFDEVKKHILSETQGAEWELIPQSQWNYEDEDGYEEPVVVKTIRTSIAGSNKSGWTKVRSRNE